MHRLTIIESGDYQEKVLPAKDRRPYGLAERGDNIFHDQSKVQLSPDKGEKGRYS